MSDETLERSYRALFQVPQLGRVVASMGLARIAQSMVGGLALAGLLPAPLLVLIVGVTSITGVLSVVGLRTLFPIIVPPPLWERVNAIDSNGYVVATTIGPPLAASLVAILR